MKGFLVANMSEDIEESGKPLSGMSRIIGLHAPEPGKETSQVVIEVVSQGRMTIGLARFHESSPLRTLEVGAS